MKFQKNVFCVFSKFIWKFEVDRAAFFVFKIIVTFSEMHFGLILQLKINLLVKAKSLIYIFDLYCNCQTKTFPFGLFLVGNTNHLRISYLKSPCPFHFQVLHFVAVLALFSGVCGIKIIEDILQFKKDLLAGKIMRINLLLILAMYIPTSQFESDIQERQK